MTRIREEITIRAPASAVWEAVHTDLENVPRWAGYLRRAESVQGRPGPNWKVRYDLELPGGFSASLTMLHTVWEPFRRCAGRFVEGPLQGDWSTKARAVRAWSTRWTTSSGDCSASRAG